MPVNDVGGTLHVELNHTDPSLLPPGFRLGDNDSRILAVALNFRAEGRDVTLVSKDLPMRVKAASVGLRAEELGVPVLKPAHPRDPDFQAELRALAPDCCPVVAYGALVPQPVLDIPVHGWVNLHFSLLPAWRGAAPVQHALLAGDPLAPLPSLRQVVMLQRSACRPGAGLGVSTGWILRTVLRKHGVETLAGVSYRRIDAEGVHILLDGQPRLVGADASHAWVGCWVPGGGWLYLAPMLDLHSRRVVAWAASESNDTELALDVFRKAVRARRPAPR